MLCVCVCAKSGHLVGGAVITFDSDNDGRMRTWAISDLGNSFRVKDDVNQHFTLRVL